MELEGLKHNCGFAVAHTLHDAYSFIKSLQHRGREVAGIAAITKGRIDVVKWEGSVKRFDITDLYNIFPKQNYDTFFAHVRYATKGSKGELLRDGHPHVIGGKIIPKKDHVFIFDCDSAIIHNGHIDNKYFKDINLENLISDCDSEKMLHFIIQNSTKGIHKALKEIPGAYTLAIAEKNSDSVKIVRDLTGIKPGVLGWKDGKYVVASEDIAIIDNGGEFIKDLEPGAIYTLRHDGKYSKENVIHSVKSHCFFEWNYLAKKNTVMDRLSVRILRSKLGEKFAEEFFPKDIDFVSFVPRCPEIAAANYARVRNLPFKTIFYKMRDERSFQGSTKKDRTDSIKNNLYLLPHIGDSLRGKNVLIMEDSIVRGNVLNRIGELLGESRAGIKKVYVASYTPQMGIIGNDGIPRGCMFGVDMPPDDNFIARGRNLKEISEKISEGHDLDMETHYLSVEGMLDVFKESGMNSKDLCTYCIGGDNPFTDMSINGKF